MADIDNAGEVTIWRQDDKVMLRINHANGEATAWFGKDEALLIARQLERYAEGATFTLPLRR